MSIMGIRVEEVRFDFFSRFFLLLAMVSHFRDVHIGDL